MDELYRRLLELEIPNTEIIGYTRILYKGKEKDEKVLSRWRKSIHILIEKILFEMSSENYNISHIKHKRYVTATDSISSICKFCGVDVDELECRCDRYYDYYRETCYCDYLKCPKRPYKRDAKLYHKLNYRKIYGGVIITKAPIKKNEMFNVEKTKEFQSVIYFLILYKRGELTPLYKDIIYHICNMILKDSTIRNGKKYYFRKKLI